MRQMVKILFMKKIGGTALIYDSNQDLCSFQEVRGELDSKVNQCSKQADLIAQLEDHVEQLQTISTPYR